MDQPLTQAVSASPGKKRGRKADGKKDGDTTPKKKKELDSRFGGKTEEEIMQLFLPDHLKPDLDVVFVSLRWTCTTAVIAYVTVCFVSLFW